MSCRYFLHNDVPSRREPPDPRLRWSLRPRRTCRRRILGPVDEPSRSRSSKYLKPWISSTTGGSALQPAGHERGEFPAEAHRRRPDVEHEVGGSRHGPVRIALEDPGRHADPPVAGRRRRRSDASDLTPATTANPPSGAERDRPGPIPSRSANKSWTTGSPPSSMVRTRSSGIGAGRERGEHGLGHRLIDNGLRAPCDVRHWCLPGLLSCSRHESAGRQGSVPDERSGEEWRGPVRRHGCSR